MSGELATCFQSVCQPKPIKHEFPKFSLLEPRAHSAAKKFGHSHGWQVDRWTGGPGAFPSHLAFPGLPWIPLCAGIHMTLSFSLSPLPHLRLPAPGRASSCCCALINNTEKERTLCLYWLTQVNQHEPPEHWKPRGEVGLAPRAAPPCPLPTKTC